MVNLGGLDADEPLTMGPLDGLDADEPLAVFLQYIHDLGVLFVVLGTERLVFGVETVEPGAQTVEPGAQTVEPGTEITELGTEPGKLLIVPGAVLPEPLLESPMYWLRSFIRPSNARHMRPATVKPRAATLTMTVRIVVSISNLLG